MSSALRMLLIAILAGGERAVKKEREGQEERKEGQRGYKVKNRLAGENTENSETFSYYAGDSIEMEQETRTCEREVMSDRVN